MVLVVNRTYDEIAVGDEASASRRVVEADLAMFAAVSGDLWPSHPRDLVASGADPGVAAHGMWSSALISALIGTKLPGPGTIYVGQRLEFLRPVQIGDLIVASARVAAKQGDGRISLDCVCRNQNDEIVVAGATTVIAPSKRIRCEVPDALRAVIHERGDRLEALVARAGGLAPLAAAVVHPVDSHSLDGALAATAAGLIRPVLIGPRSRIEAAADALGADISAHELIDAPHSHAAAAAAVALAAAAHVGVLMKGALHTDELMQAVLARDSGLRTERRVSHVYVVDTPAYHKLVFITDAAINIEPDLDAKRDIVQNAIDLAHALGVETPKVALLSAVETISPKLRSTIDAAALCKMADRGQIKGGLLDGPLAFDNAVSPDAASTKRIISHVAGDADILFAPSLEAANMIAKQLDYLAGAVAAGIVLGARVPIILTSRAEGRQARLAASAVAALMAAAAARFTPEDRRSGP